MEGYNRYLNSKLTVRNSHLNLYKFLTILKETNEDRLDDIKEYGKGDKEYKMEPKYKARIDKLKNLVDTYKANRKTNDEKLRYVDAIVSVQMWEYVDDPDMLDNPETYQP